MHCRQLEKILFPLELTVFFAQTVEFSALVARQLALIGGSDVAAIDAGLADQLAWVLLGTPSRWATAEQVRPSARQNSTASCFCSAVNWRLVLVGLVIDRQSEGHGMSPIDLSTESG